MTITNKTTFHSQGVSFPTPEGKYTLIAGNGIDIQPAGDTTILSVRSQPNIIANGNGLPWLPPAMSNGLAPNGSLYVSTTNSKLTFKAADSSIHYLY